MSILLASTIYGSGDLGLGPLWAFVLLGFYMFWPRQILAIALGILVVLMFVL